MRPYSGIGVLSISTVGLTAPIPFYNEPGLVRSGTLAPLAAQRLNDWLFTAVPDRVVLLVKARKGDWLRVERDDAGRESWLLVQRHWRYTPWPQFLKGAQVVFLPNSPKRLMQVVPQPEALQGTPRPATAPPMRVVMVQGDWAYVLLDASSAGWIRWREADGRLLVGFPGEPMQQ
ncbi:hypothetical protein [Trichlorobacter ammonificans]|nr:hypothetical protein [Trichlorobacter ammonificans]